MSFKQTLKRFCPPILLDSIRKIMGSDIRWSGQYDSWQQAQQACSGYDHEAILTQVKQATLNVVNGKAAAERDGINFTEPHYHWPLLSCLQLAYAKKQAPISIVDLGGSLGTHYFQVQPILPVKSIARWTIVEQPHFVECGQQVFQTDVLQFVGAREEIRGGRDFLLCSGVLQYLPEPYVLLQAYLAEGFQWIMLDRVIFACTDKDCLTKQTVSANICPASYPCWHLSETKLKDYMRQYGYRLVSAIACVDDDSADYYFKGLIFRKEE